VTSLLHHLPLHSAAETPYAVALQLRDATLSYHELSRAIESFATGLMSLQLARGDRVAIYLPKQFETVIAIFGTSQAGCVFVPVNPVLKPLQVQYILRDCNARVLVTSPQRLQGLQPILEQCPDLRHVVLTTDSVDSSLHPTSNQLSVVEWAAMTTRNQTHDAQYYSSNDMDMVAILYTSGSTGKPKGVVLSHRNIVTGAMSVSEYLDNRADDRLLAVLPFSFDYGFSQLTTAFLVGACAVLIDHLFARDIVRTVTSAKITGLAAVPPLWSQLAELDWPEEAHDSLRYFTNSGGAMPSSVLKKLRSSLPNAMPFLMYGLTEAFRSTYLPPSDVDRKLNSIGKAIPNAEIFVVRSDGSPCAPNEPGELVHAGPLVAMGYWNALEATAQRFRPTPGRPNEVSVWSGDTVRYDEEGFLYFIGRQDDLIKTSGYRVSPTEVEEIILSSNLVREAVAFGIKNEALGQVIVVLAVAKLEMAIESDVLKQLFDYCRNVLPTYLVPQHIELRMALPRNPNGKYDRKLLATEFSASEATP
jgi:acyl-CoA ligase (AMP-forming) (exosortase A-associated)